MGARSGTYSTDLFNEADRYQAILMQEGVPVVDADINVQTEQILAQVRRAVQFGIGDGSPNVGWKIEESTADNVNNFTVKGGGGTVETAGWIFENGFQAILVSDLEFNSTSKDIHSQITGPLSDTVLTDSSANYDINELAGRDLVPDVDIPATTIAIISNTATTITVASGLLAATAVGKHYRVNPSTPSGARTDKVYLDLFLDEIDSTEDPNLIHSLGTGNQEAARRLKLRTFVRVVENVNVPPNYFDIPADFVDGDGNQHFTTLLATLSRTASSTIIAGQIADNRKFTTTADILRVREVDSSPSVQPVTEIIVTNSTLTDNTGGVVTLDLGKTLFLEAPSADISGPGNVTTEIEADDIDTEVYQKITGNAANQSIDVKYPGKMLQLTIKELIVPFKFSDITGNNALTINVITDDGSGTVVATKVATLSTTRAEIQILDTDFSAQPTDRFLVEAVVTVDNLDVARLGGVKVEFK